MVAGVRGGAAATEFVCGDFTVLDWSDGESTGLQQMMVVPVE